MELTIADAIMLILITIGGIILYTYLNVKISSNVVTTEELKTRLAAIEKDQQENRALASKLLEKFNVMESRQVGINTLLEENLKNLVKIVDRHDVDIDYLKGTLKR